MTSPSISSVSSGYSLYSADDQVMGRGQRALTNGVRSTHKGLDRCAALLGNMMEREGVERVPKKLEQGMGSRPSAITNQQSKQTKQSAKQKAPVTKTKFKTTATRKKLVHSSNSKDKKQPKGRFFNQQLVSSTPNQPVKNIKSREKMKPALDKKSKERGRESSDVNRKTVARIPARISPANKENHPLTKHHPHGNDGQQSFIETHDVTPKVLNENVLAKTRVKASVAKNPAGNQHPPPMERHMGGRLSDRPLPNAPASEPFRTISNAQYSSGTHGNQLPSQSHHEGVQRHQVASLAHNRPVQSGNTSGMQGADYIDPYTEPWVSDVDPVRGTPDSQSHQGSNIHQQQQGEFDIHYKTDNDMGTSVGNKTVPGLNLPRIPASQHQIIPPREDLASAPVHTTQSILRDLVGKLQRMNESQIQAPNVQPAHPSPRNKVTQKDTQLPFGHDSLDVGSRGAGHNEMEQKEKTLPSHALRGSFRVNRHKIAANTGGTQDVHNGNDHLEPVRDPGWSCDHESASHKPASPVTAMQIIQQEIASGEIMSAPQTGVAGSDLTPQPQQSKEYSNVKTPPQSSHPPVAMTNAKGSSALWDQMRTLKYITKEISQSDSMKKADVQTQELLTELEEVIDTLPFTSLDRDLQTEISLALQPIRTENSQLRRRLRIANQQLRQIQLRAQAQGGDESSVSLEVLTLQSLNINLQKQVEELQCERDRYVRNLAELRTEVDELTAHKRNTQEIFNKMDLNMKDKRDEMTKEMSTLHEEIVNLNSQLESEHLKAESLEREKEILLRTIKQRDSEIKQLQQTTSNMQGILARVGRERSLKSTLPGQSKESMLQDWLEKHQSLNTTPSSRSGILDSHHQTAWKRGQRSPPHPRSPLSSYSGSNSITQNSPTELHDDDWKKLRTRQNSFTLDGGEEKNKSPHMPDIEYNEDGQFDDLDSTLIGSTLDADGTAYMSFADPLRGGQKQQTFKSSRRNLHNPVSAPSWVEKSDHHHDKHKHYTSQSAHKSLHGTLSMPKWAEKHLSHTTVTARQPNSSDMNGVVSDRLGRTVNEYKPSEYPGRADSGLRRNEAQDGAPERKLSKIFNAVEVGSVVSESTISSIASQYEAQFQVGLSKLDDDIARLQENLKGIVKR